MSNMQIDQVLAQIRSLATQTHAPAAGRMNGPAGVLGALNGAAPVREAGPTAFASLLKSGIDSANGAEVRATDMSARFERGDPGVDLGQVMLEVNKANISLHAVNEVRNRLVSAYQDIMNMQL